ncbi:MAG: hypothetical protein Q9179_006443, partial [Wetmoreana sp. 5 TL-2023]
RIDENEVIQAAGTSEMVDVQGLATTISDTEPRYSFFRYTHEVEGEQVHPIIFIYTCPSASKVKERMIYASMKRTVMETASKEGGFEIAKKVRDILIPAIFSNGTVFRQKLLIKECVYIA